MNRILIILFSLVLASCDVSDKQYVRMLSWNKFSRYISIPDNRYPLSPLPKCDYVLVTYPRNGRWPIEYCGLQMGGFERYHDPDYCQTITFNKTLIKEFKCELDNMDRVKACRPSVCLCLMLQIGGKMEKYYVSHFYVVVSQTGCYKMSNSLYTKLQQMGAIPQELEYKIEFPCWIEKE